MTDRNAYEMFLVLEEPGDVPNFQFRQPTSKIAKFIRDAEPGFELELFLVRNLYAHYYPNYADAKLLLEQSIEADLVDFYFETHVLDDLVYGIGVLRKPKQLQKLKRRLKNKQ